MKRHHHDYDLENLLDLNEVVYYIQKGKYWVKFEAKKVTPTKNIPHGIKYCLTLHDKDNKRILGYDNAHDCLPKLRKYRAKKEKWDHVHKKNHGYEHQSKLHGNIPSALRDCSTYQFRYATPSIRQASLS